MAIACKLTAVESDDLEPRVGEIRGELRDFRQATSASFNAMRQDFVDLRQDFTDLCDHVDQGFAEMRGKFDAVAAGQQQIVDLLRTIISDPGASTRS